MLPRKQRPVPGQADWASPCGTLDKLGFYTIQWKIQILACELVHHKLKLLIWYLRLQI